DQLRLIERYYLRFVRNGALLTPEQKQRMATISERLASLHTAFGQTSFTTSGIGADPGRGGPGGPAGICPIRRSAGRGGARVRWALRGAPRPLRGRAVFDVFDTSGSAAQTVGGMDGARCARRQQRQRADYPRDFGCARRAGPAARLREFRR